MAEYLYEMHQHLNQCSRCGVAGIDEVLRHLKYLGFAGVVLTDHFYHGYTAIRRNQPWEDFVAAYDRSYQLTKEAGARMDIDVLFGIEEGVGGGKEVLIYGLTPAALYRHPELQDADLETLSRVVHEEGGLVFQAHPFRVRDYFHEPWKPLPAHLLDGVETYNRGNTDLENTRAVHFAADNDLLTVAGSDDHIADGNRFGIVSPHRLRDEAALAALLLSGDYSLYT